MAEDREVLREVWDGHIPVCFRLSVDGVYTIQQPDPYYLMVPRLSYFPLVLDKVQKHFAQHLAEEHQSAEIWLDYDEQPLKWHYPIGLLFDLYANDAILPWELTVHFQDFPKDELMHCQGRLAVESYFMATIKEADALKHRSQVISGMQKKDHIQLWQGLQNDKFDQFWAVNRKLMEHTNDELFKHIPFRIYWPDQPFIQRLIRPLNDQGEKLTLKDLLITIIPEIMNEDGELKYKVITHGIEPSLETPLHWMSEHLSYPDNFLHICILPLS